MDESAADRHLRLSADTHTQITVLFTQKNFFRLLRQHEVSDGFLLLKKLKAGALPLML